MNMEAIFAIMKTTLAAVKIRPEFFSYSFTFTS